jgi:signal transduction histidine kinase
LEKFRSRRPPTARALGKKTLWGMFSRHGFMILLLLVFGFELGVVLLVIKDVFIGQEQIRQMYGGSVLGLRSIGELQYEAQETRRTTLYALSTNDGNLQVNYAEQSRTADKKVTQAIARSLDQAHELKELEVGRKLANDWGAYLKIRDEVLGRILEGSAREAIDLDLASGVTSFDRVRGDIEEIKRFYDERASQQLKVAVESDQRSVIKLMSAVVFAFLLGSIAIWAIQRSKMRAELQLAKLHMDFVASVSHELRTPITAILSAGENVRDGLVEGKELAEQGSIITGQANQLMDLVDQVLLFAATSRGIDYHHPRLLQVPEIIESVLRNTNALLASSSFTVQQDIPAGLPSVLGDLTSLSQCLQNLIENAVKYSDRERWIRLAASTDDDRKEVQISVSDHGMGIDPSELPHIFEPFYRSAQTVTAQIHGTGLGLSIAKRNAEAFGGRLSVASEIGVGTVFTLHLPAFATPAEMAVAKRGTDLEISK